MIRQVSRNFEKVTLFDLERLNLTMIVCWQKNYWQCIGQTGFQLRARPVGSKDRLTAAETRLLKPSGNQDIRNRD